MADSSAQDKTLPATPRRLEKAREEGQVARSRDLGHVAAIAGGGIALIVIAPHAAAWLKDELARSLRFDAAHALAADAMSEHLLAWTKILLWGVIPFSVVLSAIGVVSMIAIGGWTWTFQPLMPKLGVLDPIAGLGRVLSKKQLVDALRASLLALVLGSLGASWLGRHVGEFAGLLAMPLPQAIAAASGSLVAGLIPLVMALALFAAIDVPLQKRLHGERLKMSHQEVKQEQKELAGNAEVKSKVRARMREMTKRRMMTAVPKADLVVMNPTHYAVALKYDDRTMAAPRVVAKGDRPHSAAHPRPRRGSERSGARGAGAGAGALCACRARWRDSGGAVCGRCAGTGLCLSAACGDAGAGTDAWFSAIARRSGGTRSASRVMGAPSPALHRARSRPGMAGNFHLGQQMKVTGHAGPGPGAVSQEKKPHFRQDGTTT